jgi:hypothetical protein
MTKSIIHTVVVLTVTTLCLVVTCHHNSAFAQQQASMSAASDYIWSSGDPFSFYVKPAADTYIDKAVS